MAAALCFVNVNPAPVFHFSSYLLFAFFSRSGCRFAYLFCPLGVYSSSHAAAPLVLYSRSRNLAINLCFTMKSLVSGYTSNGNAKCRLGSRSDTRLFPPLTPLVSPISARPYLERHLA
jgi:hypothetical protein